MGTKLTTIDTTAGPHKYSKKGLAFLDGLAGGFTIELAAKAAGLSVRHGNRLWAMPQTKAHIRAQAAERLALAAPQAAKRLVELMGSDSQRTAFQAAELILGVNAIKPPASATPVNVKVGVQVGYVIDLSEPDERPRAAATAEVHGA